MDPFLMSQTSDDPYKREISLFQIKPLLQSFLGSSLAFYNILRSVWYLIQQKLQDAEKTTITNFIFSSCKK